MLPFAAAQRVKEKLLASSAREFDQDCGRLVDRAAAEGVLRPAGYGDSAPN